MMTKMEHTLRERIWRLEDSVVSGTSAAGNIMAQDLADYRKDVASVFSGSGETVFNGTAAHARVVVEEAFKAADERVRLVAKSLDTSIFSDEVARAASEFMNRGGKIDLVLETEAEAQQDTPLWAAIVRGGQRAKAEVRIVDPKMMSAYPFNCLTVDGLAYRYQEDRNVPVAVVGGGKALVKTAEHLDRLIDQIKVLGTPVDLSVHRQPLPVV